MLCFFVAPISSGCRGSGVIFHVELTGFYAMSPWFLRVSGRAEAQPSSLHQPCPRQEQILVFPHPASDSWDTG